MTLATCVSWWWVLVGATLGTCLGLVAMALAVMGRSQMDDDQDRADEG